MLKLLTQLFNEFLKFADPKIVPVQSLQCYFEIFVLHYCIGTYILFKHTMYMWFINPILKIQFYVFKAHFSDYHNAVIAS